MNANKFNIIVMEDNKIFNSILSQALRQHIQRKKHLIKNSEIKMYSFTDPNECFELIRSKKFNGHSIAFLDYYLGKGTNGLHMLKVFKEKNNEIKFVVLSHSDQIVNKLSQDEQLDVDGHVIKKDIYAPEICCILLEDFIQKHSP
jgi:CheY-like chemotaxis protein